MNKTLYIVVIGGLFYVLGQYVVSLPQRAEQEVQSNREITVTGSGEANAVPDVARITLSLNTGPQKDAATALSQLTSQFNNVVSTLESLGIEEKDIKATNLSIQPRYEYNDGRQDLRGYTASESVQVTIRDLDSIGRVLAATTDQGINQAGGLRFEVDDPSDLETEAQEQAIENARENAEALAKALGVKLGDVKTFTTRTGGDTPTPIYGRAELALEAADTAGTPVPAGESTVTANVTVTYSLR